MNTRNIYPIGISSYININLIKISINNCVSSDLQTQVYKNSNPFGRKIALLLMDNETKRIKMKRRTCFDENGRRGGNLQYQENLREKLDTRMSKILFPSIFSHLFSLESMPINPHRALTKKIK
jgi:hypothetical protein